MRIVVVSGSPRKGQNCEKLAEHSAKRIKGKGFDAEVIRLGEKRVGMCIACDACKKAKKCSQQDDFNSLIETIEGADALLLISPTYMGNMSGQMKCFLDRSVLFRRQGMLLRDKVGGAIAVGNSRNGGQEHVIAGIHAAMLIHGMVIAGDDGHFGGILQAPAMEDDEGMKTVDATIGKICRILERMK